MWRNWRNPGTGRTARLGCKLFICLTLALVGGAQAQTCSTDEEMDAPTHTALQATAQRYFALAAKGDVGALRENSIASVAGNFSGIAGAVQGNQANLATGKATPRSAFALTIEEQPAGQAAPSGLEFFCGAFGKSGQTASSAVFVLTDLPVGRYAVVILDVAALDGKSDPYVVSFVLQQVAGDWKLGGFYAKAAQAGGHDSAWFTERARAFAAKGETHNAWFYFLAARSLATFVPFMSTRETDTLYDESQKIMPADLPGDKPLELLAGGKSYKIKTIFAYGVAGEVNLIAKYDWPDVSDATKTYAENQAVARAMVAKWPELRDGFSAIVTRATEASGRDYGTLVAVQDLK